MSRYPTITEIEVKWRKSGSGICIIVEGETEMDDPWFYQQWFGGFSKKVSFFPQNGWEMVVDAVAVLRPKLGSKRVYGIVDRDFAPTVSYEPFPADGILRTTKYTLENYLLDPECWFEFVKRFMLRSPKPGWNTLAEVQTTTERLYRECIPLSAYNWTLQQARDRDPVAFTALRPTERRFFDHPRAISHLGDISNRLRSIQKRIGITDDLGQLYLNRQAEWQAMPLSELEEVISGKYVLKRLKEEFPINLAGRQAWDDMLSGYMYQCPEPPKNLKEIINLILKDALII